MSLKVIGAVPKESWLSSVCQDGTALTIEFLHNDLKDTSEPVVLTLGTQFSPLNQHAQLDRKLLLQIKELVDISVSVDQRYQFTSNTKGTYKLVLNDGYSDLIAITKDTISGLVPLLIPGVKILLLPETNIHCGVIFLEQEKVEILGGSSTFLANLRLSRLNFDKRGFEARTSTLAEDTPGETKIQTTPQQKQDKNKGWLRLVEEKTEKKVLVDLSDDDFDIDVPSPVLENIHRISEISKKDGEFNIIGRIDNNNSLSIVKKGYSLFFKMEVAISDQTGQLKCQVSHDILSHNLECTPEEWMSMSDQDQLARWTKFISGIRKSEAKMRIHRSNNISTICIYDTM